MRESAAASKRGELVDVIFSVADQIIRMRFCFLSHLASSSSFWSGFPVSDSLDAFSVSVSFCLFSSSSLLLNNPILHRS